MADICQMPNAFSWMKIVAFLNYIIIEVFFSIDDVIDNELISLHWRHNERVTMINVSNGFVPKKPHSITRTKRWPNSQRHQIESFCALLTLCAGNHRSPVNSPHKGQWRGALMFSLICAWTNGWVNNRNAGDLTLVRLVILDAITLIMTSL